MVSDWKINTINCKGIYNNNRFWRGHNYQVDYCLSMKCFKVCISWWELCLNPSVHVSELLISSLMFILFDYSIYIDDDLNDNGATKKLEILALGIFST